MKRLKTIKWKNQFLWDMKNMATCSCRLRRQDYMTLQRLCEKKGFTVHHIVRLLVGLYLVLSGEKVTVELQKDVEKMQKQTM